ncbi:MAG: hypothetical protein LC104_21165 [Bacteroidales bacterium]|nr:hypothetical protein [Bacteroidales bacterium]
MLPSELTRFVADICERLNISYRIVGSVAASLQGEPRSTNDIDMVLQLDSARVVPFCAAFPPPVFYCSLDAAREAVNARFQFNIIQTTTGLKVDIIIASDSDFDRSQLSRGSRMLIDDRHEVFVASPEDVIIKKLEYFKLGGSEKHLRDIVGILKVQAEAIDQRYIAEWIDTLSLQAEWRLVTDRLQGTG